MKETEGSLKNGTGNLLTQVVKALFKGEKNEMNSSSECAEGRRDRCQKETQISLGRKRSA